LLVLFLIVYNFPEKDIDLDAKLTPVSWIDENAVLVTKNDPLFQYEVGKSPVRVERTAYFRYVTGKDPVRIENGPEPDGGWRQGRKNNQPLKCPANRYRPLVIEDSSTSKYFAFRGGCDF